MFDINYFRLSYKLNKKEVEADELYCKIDRHREGLRQVFERYDQGTIREPVAIEFVGLYTDQLLKWEAEVSALEFEILSLKKELKEY